MNKTRIAKSLLKTKNYIVISDEINDGYVEPYAAESFLEQLEPIIENLKQLALDYLEQENKS